MEKWEITSKNPTSQPTTWRRCVFIFYACSHTQMMFIKQYCGSVKGKLSFYGADRSIFRSLLPIYCKGSLFWHLVTMIIFIHICTVIWQFCVLIYHRDIKITVFCNVTPWSLETGTSILQKCCCLHHGGVRRRHNSEARNFVFDGRKWGRTTKYRVIRNNCRGFNNLSYTIHLRYDLILSIPLCWFNIFYGNNRQT